MKKTAKVLRNPIFRTRLEDTKPPSKHSSCNFWRPVLEKDGGLRKHNSSAEEVRVLEVFLYKADHNFDHR
jgi:hypothetical protein